MVILRRESRTFFTCEAAHAIKLCTFCRNVCAMQYFSKNTGPTGLFFMWACMRCVNHKCKHMMCLLCHEWDGGFLLWACGWGDSQWSDRVFFALSSLYGRSSDTYHQLFAVLPNLGRSWGQPCLWPDRIDCKKCEQSGPIKDIAKQLATQAHPTPVSAGYK